MTITVLVLVLLLLLVLFRPRKGVVPSPGRDAPSSSVSEPPVVDVIVAFKNEEPILPQKICNLRSLCYPQDRLRFYLVDGNSTDCSHSLVQKLTADDPRFLVLQGESRGKTDQLNHALRRSSAPFVLVTDADALMPTDALLQMVSMIGVEAHGAVSTIVSPVRAIRLEKMYWKLLNSLRRLEAYAGCCSSLLAPAYLFRRELVNQLPADVVADDLYVSFLVLARGRTLGLIESETRECRAPISFHQFVFHKFRKANAYALELIRFVPFIPQMAGIGRLVFISRLVELVVLPAVLAALAVVLLWTWPKLAWVYAGVAGAALMGDLRFMPRTARLASLLAWLVVLSVSATLSLAVVGQSSNFKKVG